MNKSIAIALAAAITTQSIPPSAANPAAAIGASACATSGVCGVIVGTVIVAGVLYYVIANGRNQYQIPIHELMIQPTPVPSRSRFPRGEQRIDDPDRPIDQQMIDYVWGDSREEAEENCRRLAANAGVSYNFVRRTRQRGKKWECHVMGNHPESIYYPDPRRGR